MILVHGIPFYWGVETEPLDRSFVTRATLHEALPPYRLSTRAIRIRVSHRHWLHLGLCRYADTVTPWGLEVDPNQIGAWGRKSDVEEEDDTADTTAEQVRSLWPSGPDRPAGGDADAERATVPGTESLRDGPGVGAGSA